MRRVLVSLLLVACASRSPKATPTPLTEAEAAGDHAPRPFTAEQLRDGMPVGTELRYELASTEETHVEHWVVTAADEKGCVIANTSYTPEGALLSGPTDWTNEWQALVEHATYPPDATISDSSVDVPAGHFETRYYEAHTAEDGAQMVMKVHFAPVAAGPPVLMTVERDGVVVASMKLLARTAP